MLTKGLFWSLRSRFLCPPRLARGHLRRCYAQKVSPPRTFVESGGEEDDLDHDSLTRVVQQEAERWGKLSPEQQRQDIEKELKEFEWLVKQKEVAELAPEFVGYETKIAEMLSVLKPAGLPLISDDRLVHDSDHESADTIAKQAQRHVSSNGDAKIVQPTLVTKSLVENLRHFEIQPVQTLTATATTSSAPMDRELEELLDEDSNRISSTDVFVAPEDDSLIHVKKSPAPLKTTESFTVLFEDDQILAVAKPPGIVVIPSRDEHTEKHSMLAILREKHESLRAVLTLDSQSSGVVLFAKTREAFSSLTKSVEVGQLTNTFIGWVEGKLNKQEGNISIPLQSGRKSKMRPADGWTLGPEQRLTDSITKRKVPVHQMANAATIKAKLPALTRFILSRLFHLPKGQTVSRVLFRPLTHRQHQIRVHMRAVDLPLLVDSAYGYNSALRANALGSGSPPLGTLSLHNMDVTFMHPKTGLRTKISCPLSSCNPELKRLDDWLVSACPKNGLVEVSSNITTETKK